LLEEYAHVDSIFTVGWMALCMKADGHAQIPALRRISRHLAIAGQILDDLEDVADDLRRSRFNYVANVLSRPAERRALARRGARALPCLTRRLVLEPGGLAIIHEVARHLKRAHDLASPLRLPLLDAYLRAGRNAVDAMALSLHRRQVRYVLRPLLSTG
jgi:hypothetical protein